MNRILRLALILGAILVVACAVCFWAVKTSVSERVPLPNPNGYDDFLAAAKMLNGASSSVDLKQVTAEQLRTIVLNDHAPLERLRLGLGRPCRVPIEYSASYMQQHLGALAAIKQDVLALQAEGRLAELENRPADAAASYLAEIKLGVNAAHGGVLIDLLVSTACEALGVKALASEFQTLNARQARELARQLEELDRDREPLDRVLEQERIWARNAMPFEFLVFSLRSIVMGASSDPTALARTKAMAKSRAQHRVMLQLEATLAARAYELEKDRAPTGWNDLVPAYLSRIPADPETKSNLDYSFGPNHQP